MVRAIPPTPSRRPEGQVEPASPAVTRADTHTAAALPENEARATALPPSEALASRDVFVGAVPTSHVDDVSRREHPLALGERPASSPLSIQLASARRSTRDDVAFEVRTLKTRLTLAAAALPETARPAFERATSESASRILSSFEAGRVDVAEARRALRMLQELAGVLIEMHAGRTAVTSIDALKDASDMQSIEVRATTGDVVRVSVRAVGGSAGEARVKLENVVDDGAPVRASDRMIVRFDLAGSRGDGAAVRAAVDVQFGHERFDPANPSYEHLNKRIHGVLLDEQGQPVLNRGGNTVADHHFSEDVPDALHDEEGFATFARAFLASLTPVESGERGAAP